MCHLVQPISKSGICDLLAIPSTTVVEGNVVGIAGVGIEGVDGVFLLCYFLLLEICMCLGGTWPMI